MKRVLSVASECVPLVKTGGLADVVGALPGALAELGDGLVLVAPGEDATAQRLMDVMAVEQDAPGVRLRLIGG